MRRKGVTHKELSDILIAKGWKYDFLACGWYDPNLKSEAWESRGGRTVKIPAGRLFFFPFGITDEELSRRFIVKG